MRRTYYFDEDLRSFVEGHPPCRVKKYGEAPFIITNSIQPFYHQAAQKWCDNKTTLRDFDRACGTVTIDKHEPADTSPLRENERRRHQDLHEAMHKSIAQIDAGTAPLTDEVKEICAKENDRVSKALNFDAFNIAGRKKNARGKKFRR